MENFSKQSNQSEFGFVLVRGARHNNLKNIDIDIPRGAFVSFTGVSGSGKSSIAFGTIFAEAQRRYFESIAPYARRLISQLPAPRVREILGLPPCVALQQRRGEASIRSSVGTLTALSNSLRMLFSRAGTYPDGAARLDSDAFSPNTPAGACQACHGLGISHTVSEKSLVPDPALSIRERAIAAWPGAWQGKNFRDILATLGYDIDKPWKELSKKDRDWILFTDERPVVTVHAEREAHRIQRPYKGTYMSAAQYVLHTFATTNSATLRKRVEQFMETSLCSQCKGKRLRPESLAIKYAGYDIAEMVRMPLARLSEVLSAAPELQAANSSSNGRKKGAMSPEKIDAAKVISDDLLARISLLKELGLDYLSMDRATPTLSAGELQRLRLATQIRAGLFGVVYVLDEPSAGLHPADTEALLKMLKHLKESGNSLFVVEHEMDIVRQSDWIVDIGPGAGDGGGSLIYSGAVAGIKDAKASVTRLYLFDDGNTRGARRASRVPRSGSSWMRMSGVYRHNLRNLTVEFPLGLLTVVTGVSGAGKSTLVSQVLSESLRASLGATEANESDDLDVAKSDSSSSVLDTADGVDDVPLGDEPLPTLEGAESIRRLVCVDQKPIGRTPRSNLATYTGLFDIIRKRFAATDDARKRGYTAGRFSFNVAGGRCTTCDGEGFVSVELMFLPTVYSPCSMCQGSRYNPETLDVRYEGLNIAQVLELTVDAAMQFFSQDGAVKRALSTLQDVGLGYLRLGQPATELSGGEAQRIKLAKELQREQRGRTLYLLDEPTTGLHPADVEQLMALLHRLVDAGNTVIIVEHDLDVVSQADWVIDIGPGAGDRGGRLVACGPPSLIARTSESPTAPYLRRYLDYSAK